MGDYVGYDKVLRLGKTGTEGFLDGGPIVVMPKLDGTNGSVWMEDGFIKCGSKARVLSIGSDNAGFCRHILEERQEQEQAYLQKYPDRRLYGEWLVPHTIRGYEQTAWRKFYVFDVSEGGIFLPYDEYKGSLFDFQIQVVPALVYTHLIDGDEVRELCDRVSRWMMKEDQPGEGIVLKRYNYVNKFGAKPHVKVTNTGFNARPAKVIVDNEVELSIAKSCIDANAVYKAVSKVLCARDEEQWEQKMIPHLLEILFKDVIEEKLYDVVKKGKVTVNFGQLKGAIVAQAKKECPEYF